MSKLLFSFLFIFVLFSSFVLAVTPNITMAKSAKPAVGLPMTIQGIISPVNNLAEDSTGFEIMVRIKVLNKNTVDLMDYLDQDVQMTGLLFPQNDGDLSFKINGLEKLVIEKKEIMQEIPIN